MARVGPNLLQGGGGRPGICLKAGSATTEGPGPDPQSTFTPNLLSLGIYFQRLAGKSIEVPIREYPGSGAIVTLANPDRGNCRHLGVPGARPYSCVPHTFGYSIVLPVPGPGYWDRFWASFGPRPCANGPKLDPKLPLPKARAHRDRFARSDKACGPTWPRTGPGSGAGTGSAIA